MKSIRQEKVENVITQELSAVIMKKGNAILAKTMITITAVDITPDLSYAKVYVSLFPSAEPKEDIQTLKAHTAELRFELGKRIRNSLRIVPELNFILDDSYDRAKRIDELLKS